MKKKLISSMLLALLTFSFVGCGEDPPTKTISGIVAETPIIQGTGRYTEYYIVVKTDSGNVKLKCSETFAKAVNKDLRVKIICDEEFSVKSIDLGGE